MISSNGLCGLIPNCETGCWGRILCMHNKISSLGRDLLHFEITIFSQQTCHQLSCSCMCCLLIVIKLVGYVASISKKRDMKLKISLCIVSKAKFFKPQKLVPQMHPYDVHVSGVLLLECECIRHISTWVFVYMCNKPM